MCVHRDETFGEIVCMYDILLVNVIVNILPT